MAPLPTKFIARCLALDQLSEFMAARETNDDVHWVPQWTVLCDEIRASENELVSLFAERRECDAFDAREIEEIASSRFEMCRVLTLIVRLSTNVSATCEFDLESRVRLMRYAVRCDAENAFVHFYAMCLTTKCGSYVSWNDERRRFFNRAFHLTLTDCLRRELADHMIRVIFEKTRFTDHVWPMLLYLDSYSGVHLLEACVKNDNVAALVFLIDQMTIVRSSSILFHSKSAYSICPVSLNIINNFYWSIYSTDKVDFMRLIAKRLDYSHLNEFAYLNMRYTNFTDNTRLEHICLFGTPSSSIRNLIVRETLWNTNVVDSFAPRIAQLTDVYEWIATANEVGALLLGTKLSEITGQKRKRKFEFNSTL